MSTIIVFALMFSAMLTVIFSMGGGLVDTFDELTDAWFDSQERSINLLDTKIIRTTENPKTKAVFARLIMRNDGKVSLSDFADWNVIVEIAEPTEIVIAPLTYTASTTIALNQWGIQGIYTDAAALASEYVEPGVLNPGEEMIALLNATSTLTVGVYGRATFSTPGGASASVIFEVIRDPIYYLHNNPTPPTSDTTSQSVLSTDISLPTSTELYNYDTDRDGSKGLVIVKGGVGPSEPFSTKTQVWRSGVLTSPLLVAGNGTADLWSAMKNFTQATSGEVTMYLRDYNGATYTEIGNGTLTLSDWQDGSGTWVKRSIPFVGLNHIIPAGNELEITITVGASSGTDMWFAYDTSSYPSVFNLP